MQLHRTTIETSEAMLKTNRIIKDMKAIDMSAGSTNFVEDMEVEVNSLGIMTTDHVGPSNVSRATKKVIDTQTSHTRIEPISNFILAFESMITH